MRTLTILLLAVTLSACRREEAAAPPQADAAAGAGEVVTYAGAGRDRLCLAKGGGVASFVTYATDGETNCSVRGTWDPKGAPAIRPSGDKRCAIPFEQTADGVQLLQGGAACAYYCGPKASFAGKSFKRMSKPVPVTDLAGDPLC